MGTALADENRRRLLLELLEEPAYPADLAERLGMTRGNVSNHLSCPRGCGLVRTVPVGRRVRYELADVVKLAHALAQLASSSSSSTRRIPSLPTSRARPATTPAPRPRKSRAVSDAVLRYGRPCHRALRDLAGPANCNWPPSPGCCCWPPSRRRAWWSTILQLGALVVGAATFVPGTLRALLTGRLGVGLLMTIAAVGAVALGEYGEAAMLAFLFSIAEGLEGYAVARTRHGLRALLDLVPPAGARAARRRRDRGHPRPTCAWVTCWWCGRVRRSPPTGS